MLFEPLVDLLRVHGDDFKDKLSEISKHLFTIAENTEAQIARNQWASKSLETAKESNGELRNESAYGWLIRSVFSSQTGNIFLGSIAIESQLSSIKENERESVRWYVPPGGVIFFENKSEKSSHLNLQLEILVTTSLIAKTGRSEEHIDSPRLEPVPSGSPLTAAPTNGASGASAFDIPSVDEAIDTVL